MNHAMKHFGEAYQRKVDNICESVHQTTANEKAIHHLHSAVGRLETTRHFDKVRAELGCQTLGVSDEVMTGVKEMAHLMEAYLVTAVPPSSADPSNQSWCARMQQSETQLPRAIQQFIEINHKNNTLDDVLLAAANQMLGSKPPEPHYLYEKGGAHTASIAFEILLSLIYPDGQEAANGKNSGPAR